jgi:hypothetical protein
MVGFGFLSTLGKPKQDTLIIVGKDCYVLLRQMG